jgi:hypothetical protein
MTEILIAVGAFVAGAVASYLFLRVNPNKRAALDAEVNRFHK